MGQCCSDLATKKSKKDSSTDSLVMNPTNAGHEIVKNKQGGDEDQFEVLATLKKVPLLQRLTDKQRASLGKGLIEVTFKDGEPVFKQGDKGTDFFLIKEGEAVVSTSSAEKKEEEVATLRSGDYFGESALITSNPRGATIRARGKLIVLKLDGRSFASLRKLNVQFAKRNAISAEAGPQRTLQSAVDEAFAHDKNRNYDKSPEAERFIMDLLSKHLLFSTLSEKNRRIMMQEMYKLDVVAGTKIIKQGERGDNFYVVENGNFSIIITRSDNIDEQVGTSTAGGAFGELALMYGDARRATVTAVVDSVVWVVDRYMFRRMMIKISEDSLKENEKILEKVDLFSSLLSGERTKIAEALEEVNFDDKAVVVREGDKGNQFYIIREGVAVVTKKHQYEDGEEPPEDEEEGEDEVAVYQEGDFFGERALLSQEERAATVKAKGKLVCLTLDETAFRRLLGPLGDILKKRVAEYDKQNAVRKSNRGSRLSTTSAICNVRRQLTRLSSEYDHIEKLTDIEIIGTLGRGSFGHVQLVKDPVTNATFALKEVARSQVVELGQQEHILNEKRIMMRLDCSFLIKLYRTFKSDNYLYFLQEVALGGELFNILRNRVRFDEDTARFYTACVVLGFEAMHKQDIIFRDLKPENLLLDDQGFLKITDFGFAKVCKDRAHTLCGTPDYLAPEMILGRGHAKGVDWWTLGILLYEMLVSYPPFYNEDDQMATYLNIVKADISYPTHLTDHAVDLIASLLERNPSRRLGVTKGGVAAIKRHKFFKGFDWPGLEARRMTPPIIPTVKDTSDLSNFPPAPEEDGPAAPYQDDGSGWDDEF